MPSLWKHHLDTADAKRPKHHLDTSRKPPKPQAKKLFHVTFGIHIKQSLEPQSTCPAYANTIWNHIKQLWSHRAHAQPMQTPSGHCRCKKTQTPSRHEPKTAQTASQKTVSRYLWNPHKTIFGATEHMPSLCKHHVDTADAKRPKHRAQTPKTSKLLGALPLCEGVGGFMLMYGCNSWKLTAGTPTCSQKREYTFLYRPSIISLHETCQ